MAQMEKPVAIMNCSGPDADEFGDLVYETITDIAEQEAGEVAEWDLWAGRYSRYIAYIDSYGARWVCVYASADVAKAVMQSVDRDYHVALADIPNDENEEF